MSAKTELCGRHVRLRVRLKLFNAVVTPTFLYGSGTWTMTAERERRIRTTQRRMLRWMPGVGRRRNEPDTDVEDDMAEPEENDGEKESNHSFREDGNYKRVREH